mmetsp:Transcript_6400/g.9323  ORF Transcript_6400/g.9323 Transcript_6400/m.9323 type:complete len:279 (+) Transcript_6400:21-857(+)
MSVTKENIDVHSFLSRSPWAVEAAKTNQPTQLVTLISNRRWNGLVLYISTKHGSLDASKAIEQVNEKGQNPLHFACLLSPPVFVVADLVRECPEIVFQLDLSGQSALHAAVSSGSSLSVIQFLTTKNPLAASLSDINGKTPLILACENCNFFNDGHLVQVVKLLSQASPLTVDKEDFDGMSALEHAICGGVTKDVVKTLQKALANAWDKRKEEKEEISRVVFLKSQASKNEKVLPSNKSLPPIYQEVNISKKVNLTKANKMSSSFLRRNRGAFVPKAA